MKVIYKHAYYICSRYTNERRSTTSQTTTRRTNLPTKSTVIPIKPTFVPTINYKPTFKPSVIIADVANVEVTIPPLQSTSSPVPTTSIDEKTGNLTSILNQLSSNSLLNVLVVFGLPAMTAMLSFMGAGPLAIASAAWLIPIAAVMLLPDLRRDD